MSKILLGEMTREEARERFAVCDLAILPVGSLEQHGPHLPLSTDAFDALYVSEKSVEKVSDPKPVVCPPINYGVSGYHMDFPGTITLSPQSLEQIVYEIGESLFMHGIRKLLIINGHGGNVPALKCAAQQLNHDLDLFVSVNSGEAWAKERKELFKGKNDVHSGEYETSTTLANRGHLVQMDKAVNGEMNFPSKYMEFEGDNIVAFKCRFKEITPTGVCGDATKADKERGQKLWNAAIKNTAELIEDLKRMKL